jgi:nucleoside 2-deoxyribosyltransferase
MPKSSHPPKIYLAGPEVFLRDPEEIGRAKVAVCALHGLDGRFPLAADGSAEQTPLSLEECGYAIFRANEALMRECDALIANLTPLRGPSMDVGTAFEIGFMSGLGRPVFGYTNSHLPLFDRTLKFDRKGFRRRKGAGPGVVFEDTDQLAVEQFGFVDNLMIDGALHESGGVIVARKTKRRDRYTDLSAFEECVAAAAEILRPDISSGSNRS